MVRNALFLFNLLLVVFPLLSHGSSEEIPLKPGQYLIESVAKIDDLIEEVEYKERVNTLDRISFTISTLANLTPLSLSMLSYRLQYSSTLPIEIVGQLTKSEMTMTTLQQFFNNLALGATSLKFASEGHQFQTQVKNISIHRNDLLILKKLLKEIRQKQFDIFVSKFQKEKSAVDKIKIENQILEMRPTYREIYEQCRNHPTVYKNQVQLKILKGSLYELYRLTGFSPAMIKLHLNSKLTSPTLNRYLSQQTMPPAVQRCFNENKLENKNAYADFIQHLHIVENLARGFVISTVGNLFLIGQRLGDHAKIQNIINYFSKSSLILAKKAVIITTIVASIYASIQLKMSYDIASDHDISRYTSKEYEAYLKNYYKHEVLQHILSVEQQLKDADLKTNLRDDLQAELNEWKIIDNELSM